MWGCAYMRGCIYEDRYESTRKCYILTVPSIKTCTCVNKWKSSGSRWMLDNNITRCPDGSSQMETGCRSENQLVDWGLCGPHWPTVEQPKPRCKRNAAMVEEELGINIAVRPCLHSFLTHNKHHPFENKVWERYIFIKKCIRLLLKSSLPVNGVSACKCIFVYVHV